MADICAEYHYAGLTINGAANTDTAIVSEEGNGITGLDGAPVRRQVDDLAGTNGGDSQPAHLGFRPIVFNLTVVIGTLGNEGSPAAYNTKMMTLQKAWISALEGQLNSASALTWTDATGDSQSISCMYGMPGGEIQFSGPLYKTQCSFTLLAEDPTIS